MPSLLIIISSLLVAISAILCYNHGLNYWGIAQLSELFISQHSLNGSPPPYHNPSWRTWFNPSQSVSENHHRLDRTKGWNLLHHLGGYGPWIEKVAGTQGIAPPDRCSVEQVHMMSRHAERYPTRTAGNRHLALLNRIKEANVPMNGSLSFLNSWTYFTDNPSVDFEQLTRTGPYAGTLEAFTTGVRFRSRYGHLLPKASKLRFWASDSKRVIETAQYFASGLFELDWDKKGLAELEIIPETFDRRADTLTPGDTCLKYLEDTVHGHDRGVNMLAQFQQAYLPAISDRLISTEKNSALGKFTNWEVFSMQEMCGFETLARGSSLWCEVFTEEDWNHFEYARDVIHYYRAGPGNPYAGAMGWLWLNATTSTLRAGPEAGTMFFSFVHDGDIAPFLTALNIFEDPKYDPNLPTSHVAKDRVWRTSSVLPMGGRITLERLTCSLFSEDSAEEEIFVRVNVNDAIVPLPYCKSGPGKSCPLNQFVQYVQQRRKEVGEFAEVCGLEGDVGRITFLHQHR